MKHEGPYAFVLCFAHTHEGVQGISRYIQERLPIQEEWPDLGAQ